ncbi:MAG: hypothetical protein ACI85O_000092 [Saprospiraceae bacterium]|jgi:hypothetical protein
MKHKPSDMTQQYRYPGAKPFQTDESHVFYGRAGVSQELYQLINLEPLVVLHAKSGLGKSSVINAGLMPIIAEAKEYTPFNIRFHADTKDKKEMPLGITQDIVQSQSDLLDKIRPEGEDSLWYHLKSRQLTATEDKGIFLIFDQFEELFTYDDAIVEEFARQLSEAFYSTLPQRFRDKRKAGFEKDANFLSSQELEQLDQALNLRFLMVIRSDRMSLMKKLKAYFPTILSADFELQPLDREQAEDAILSPAYQKVGFITPIFDYEDDAIEYLLDFLSEDGTEPIESFQLQILCEYVEQHLVAKQGKTVIKKADIANPDQILENYYLDKINSITNPTQQLAARRLIEEGFIFEEEERRLTLYEGQIFKSYGINQDLLNQLLDTHLIRSEPSLRGGYTYELSHDTLVVPVLKAKVKRKEAERLIREQEELQVREAELLTLRKKEAAAREQAEKEKQLRTEAELNEKRARQRTRLATVVSIFALLLSGLAFWFWRNAEESNRVSELRTEEAIDANEATKGALVIVEQKKIEADLAAATAERQRIRASESEMLAKDNEKRANQNLVQANKRFASYLASEAEKAFEIEDIRLAYRLVEAAEQYDKNNEKVLGLKDLIPSYASQFILRGLYHELSFDKKYLTFITKGKEGNNDVLHVLDLSKSFPPRSFENSDYKSYHEDDSSRDSYSPDGKYLLFSTKGKGEDNSVLQVLDLSKSSPPRSFENSRKYRYSPDGKYLTFFTTGKERGNSVFQILDLSKSSPPRSFEKSISYNESYRYSPDGKYLAFFTQRKEGFGHQSVLQVLDLSKSSPPRSFENSFSESFSFDNNDGYSPDGKYLTFFTRGNGRGTSVLQVLDLSKSSPPRSFEDSHYKDRYGYSLDGEYLTFFTSGNGKGTSVLQVLDLSESSPPRSFKNSQRYGYSPDGKYLTFFTEGNGRGTSVLQVLDLSKSSPPRSFENIAYKNYRYSPDGKYLIFFTKGKEGDSSVLQVLDLSKSSPPRSFENSISDEDSYKYSPDGKYLTFFTEGKDGSNFTLQVLDLSKSSPPRSFENSQKDNYSPDGKYLTFFTRGKELDGGQLLQVLDLSKSSLPRSFEKSYSNRYSPDGKYLTFSAKSKEGDYDVLQVLNLSKSSPPRSFENSYISSGYSSDCYSPDGKYLTFFAKSKEGGYDILQVLNLSKSSFPLSFENSKIYRYSPDGNYLAFITKGKESDYSIQLLELESGKIIRTVGHQYKPELKFLNNNTILTTFENPISEESIYKIINFSLGDNQQAFEYYKEKIYFPLSKKEKEQYGL